MKERKRDCAGKDQDHQRREPVAQKQPHAVASAVRIHT
jgi:hypothetical protein